VLAGHSLAGEELSSIGSRHADKVAGLIYLDAAYAYAFYDSTRGDFRADVAVLKQRLERLQIAGSRGEAGAMDSLFSALLDEDLPALRRDLIAMQNARGQIPVGTPMLPPVRTGIELAVDDGLQRYSKINGPVLAIFKYANPPAGVGTDPRITQQWLQRDRGNPGTFARGVPQANVVVLPNADHFVFNSNPAEVLALMRTFIDALPRR
jgi:pimeloyl-ACP methyl ester carboxylesterase